MIRNSPNQKITLLAVDSETGLPKTGDAANLTFYVSKDDGSVVALTDTTATELDATNAPGLYSCDLTQAETDAYKLAFSGKSSTANVVVAPETIYTRPANFSVLAIDSSGRGQVQYGTSTGQVNLTSGNLAGAVPSVTAGVTVTTNNDKTGYSLSSAGVQAIWDALTSALTTVGSIGKLLVDNINATISSRLASSSYTAPDNTGIATAAAQATTAATQATNAAASASSADGKLTANFTNMVTRFVTMIESYSGGTLWRFITGALSQAPAGGGGGAGGVLLVRGPFQFRASSASAAGVVLASAGEAITIRGNLVDGEGEQIPTTGATLTAQVKDLAGTVILDSTVAEDNLDITVLLADEGLIELALPLTDAAFVAGRRYRLIFTRTLSGNISKFYADLVLS